MKGELRSKSGDCQASGAVAGPRQGGAGGAKAQVSVQECGAQARQTHRRRGCDPGVRREGTERLVRPDVQSHGVVTWDTGVTREDRSPPARATDGGIQHCLWHPGQARSPHSATLTVVTAQKGQRHRCFVIKIKAQVI